MLIPRDVASLAARATQATTGYWPEYPVAVPAPSHRLREGDELVEGFSPTVVKAHVRVFFGGFLVAVDRYRGVLRAGAVWFERDHRGKERHITGCVLRAVAGLERGGPDEFFVLDRFE